MNLKTIYQPIEKDLVEVDTIIKKSLNNFDNKSLLKINQYLLDSLGKRIRPGLVILSAKAVNNGVSNVAKIAAAMELIHMASLLHDDVMDNSSLRHNQPTVNAKFGDGIPIGLGDYLYSTAFELIADSGDNDLMKSVVSAVKEMSEGQLLQVLQRGNLDLSKEQYLTFVEKKTASLFAASCEVGGLNRELKQFGLNFGIAFQIIDDYMDLMGEEKKLGKGVQQDLSVGEVTLPLIYLFEEIPDKEKKELKALLSSKDKKVGDTIRSRLTSSGADKITKKVINSYLDKAKESLVNLEDSMYKESFIQLVDFVQEKC